MEPFQKKRLIDRYRRRLNMETAYANINGQIWLFFDAMVEWELGEDTEQQVTVRVLHHEQGQHMMMTFVYAKCSAMERLELWDHLYYLASDMKLEWLVGGDFNVILHEEEKTRGLLVHPPKYEDFAFCVNSCGLFEQGYKGSPFTGTGSDHTPLLMTCGEQTTNFVKTFRFLNFWTKHATFMDVDIVMVKEMFFEEEPKTENRIVLQKAQSDLKKYLSIEEQYWKQKAGMTWFAEGDRNTIFFHNHFNGKRKKLQLNRIKSRSGVWIEDQEQLAITAVDFYQKQFTNEGDISDFSLLNNVPSMVTMERNLELSR
uniref:Craniofacial development protein 2-like n=1 Tax=Nicotiana tabacum TaxID=4097 RepID=A0A1S4DRJ9_TOBAC|nr:PREDICTED: uncharacterized protein LOC107832701 [Nicotiana tabacum]